MKADLLTRLSMLLLSLGALFNGGYWEVRHRLVLGGALAVLGIFGVMVAAGAVGGQADG